VKDARTIREDSQMIKADHLRLDASARTPHDAKSILTLELSRFVQDSGLPSLRSVSGERSNDFSEPGSSAPDGS
jgi:hypothetical protein